MAERFLKIAVVYLVIGVFFGMFMAISHNFDYATAHAHINLLGWATLALSGLIYHAYPAAGNSTLGKWHFWLHNIGLPIMMIGLIILESGTPSVEPVISVGATLTTIGIICFLVNVFKNVKRAR